MAGPVNVISPDGGCDLRNKQIRQLFETEHSWNDPPIFTAELPSGKRLHNYGTSPFLMGKFMKIHYEWAIFNSYVTNYQRVSLLLFYSPVQS